MALIGGCDSPPTAGSTGRVGEPNDPALEAAVNDLARAIAAAESAEGPAPNRLTVGLRPLDNLTGDDAAAFRTFQQRLFAQISRIGRRHGLLFSEQADLRRYILTGSVASLTEAADQRWLVRLVLIGRSRPIWEQAVLIGVGDASTRP